MVCLSSPASDSASLLALPVQWLQNSCNSIGGGYGMGGGYGVVFGRYRYGDGDRIWVVVTDTSTAVCSPARCLVSLRRVTPRVALRPHHLSPCSSPSVTSPSSVRYMWCFVEVAMARASKRTSAICSTGMWMLQATTSTCPFQKLCLCDSGLCVTTQLLLCILLFYKPCRRHTLHFHWLILCLLPCLLLITY